VTPNDTTTLVHFVGFLAGVALYAMLAVMTLRSRAEGDRIPLATAILGLVWNSVALVIYGTHDLGLPAPLPRAWPWIVALAFTCLGFLPAVVVHSAVQSAGKRTIGKWLVALAYSLSTAAGALQLFDASRGEPLPSRTALYILTVGFCVLVGALVLYTRRQPGWRRALTAVALAAFAVMALHLPVHAPGDFWASELVGHHASLPLAFVILYQDYRFALADLFLKRALTLLVLLAIVLTLYQLIIVPIGLPAGGLMLLALWVGTAIAYPFLRRRIHGIVDRWILRRADYRRVRESIAGQVATLNSESAVLDAVVETLRGALGAGVTWHEGDGAIRVPASDAPAYAIEIGALSGGRRLMSDDIAMLDAVALTAARRIDAVRVERERYGRDLREREILQLATQAELTALRAQLNPHFLFNALTTIGYLMEEAPQRALDTLFRLTGLLRAVLKRPDADLATLGDEMEIVRSYLAIEGARFEERLSVTIDVPDALAPLPLPPLLLQPLVENAIKHGITPRKDGGRLMLTASIDQAATLVITIADTGVGVSAPELARRRARGIGLTNVGARLKRYYGDAASLAVRSAPGIGTTVEVRVPKAG
jgi:two-component system, LytTR family, sensor kinase